MAKCSFDVSGLTTQIELKNESSLSVEAKDLGRKRTKLIFKDGATTFVLILPRRTGIHVISALSNLHSFKNLKVT